MQIDKEVPIPTSGLRTGLMDTLRKMEVGDSFAHPLTKRSSLGFAMSKMQTTGRKFTSRKVSDTEVRVWRVA